MNDQVPMTRPEPGGVRFDLEERTGSFGEAIIAFAKHIPRNDVTQPLVSQLVRAGTSIGANYVEADDADSKKDFRFKIGLCRREAKETKHWLRMVVAAEPTTVMQPKSCGVKLRNSISFSPPSAASSEGSIFVIGHCHWSLVIHWSFWFGHWSLTSFVINRDSHADAHLHR